MASEVEICNRALQKLGARRIVDLTEDTVNGRACNSAYKVLRDRELRKHPWNFAITRVQLAADSTAPIFERARAFTLPSDFIRLLPLDPETILNSEDRQIEGKKIITDESSPLNVRYVYRITDPNEMDVLFRESLSMRIAYELAEELTQSNTKKDEAKFSYDEAIADAKKTNAIERVALVPPEDTWVTKRA